MDKIKENLIVYDKIIIFLAILAFSVYFSFLTISQFRGLKTQMNDLGNMQQAVWGIGKGHFFINSNNFEGFQNTSSSRFAKHANFILVLFAPFYRMYPSPELLLVSQVIIVSLGAFPLFLISRKVLGRSVYALLPSFFYLMNVNVQDAVLYDFHPEIFIMTILFTSFYLLQENKILPFILTLGAAILLKENVALTVAAVGVYLIFFRQRIKLGVGMIVISLLYFVFVTAFFMPRFAGMGASSIVQERYSMFGSNIWDISFNIVRHPVLFFSTIFSKAKMFYLSALLFPFLFLPLLLPSVLIIAIPEIIINLLSSNSITYTPFFFYYSASIVSVFILTMPFVIRKLIRTNKEIIIKLLLVVYLVYSWALSPAPYSPLYSYKDYSYSRHSLKINYIKDRIRDGASVSVQNNLGPHVANRERVFTFPVNSMKVDYVLLDINDPFSEPKVFPRPYNFIYYSQTSLEVYEREIERMFLADNYKPVYYTNDGYLLFKRNAKTEMKGARQMFETRMSELNKTYNDYDKYLQ